MKMDDRLDRGNTVLVAVVVVVVAIVALVLLMGSGDSTPTTDQASQRLVEKGY